jgi:hypothetical protein
VETVMLLAVRETKLTLGAVEHGCARKLPAAIRNRSKRR